MDSPSSLLQQLRIDRDDVPQTRQPGRRRWWLAATIVVIPIVTWTLARSSGNTEPAEDAAPAAPTPPPVVHAATAIAAPTALDASGYVVARRQATVSSKTTGRVDEVLIEEGQRVEKGQAIARLDASTANAALAEATARLAQAQAALDASRIAADDAQPIFQRNEQQHARALISSQAFDGAKAAYDATRADLAVKARAVEVARAGLLVAQRDFDDTIIRAPFGGIVTVKAAQPGEIVSPLSNSGGFARTGIGTIVDMDSLEVEVDVSENFIALVHPGQQAIVRLNAYPDVELPAEAVAVIPAVDRSKATVRVRVRFKQIDPRILPDMGVKVTFLQG